MRKSLLIGCVALLFTGFLFGRERFVSGAVSGTSSFEVIRAEYGVFSEKPDIYLGDKVALENVRWNKFISGAKSSGATYSKEGWRKDSSAIMTIDLNQPKASEKGKVLTAGNIVTIVSFKDEDLFLAGWGLSRSVAFSKLPASDTRRQWIISRREGDSLIYSGTVKNGDIVSFKSNHKPAGDRYLYSYWGDFPVSDGNWKDSQAGWKIIKAVEGLGKKVVTSNVKSFIASGRKFKANDQSFGDPAPGLAKWLKVVYKVGGEEKIGWFFQGMDVKFPELKKAIVVREVKTVAPSSGEVVINRAQYGLFLKEKPEIWSTDRVTLKNKKWGKYIAKSDSSIAYVETGGSPDAQFALQDVSADKKASMLDSGETVLLKFIQGGYLSLGGAWRQLVISGGAGTTSQWNIIKKTGRVGDRINNDDDVLIQNKEKNKQYLFSYFDKFPVHDSRPGDEQSVYVIRKAVDGDPVIDLTSKVQEFIAANKSFKISDLVGDKDPAPGCVKWLKVEYTRAGKKEVMWANSSSDKILDFGVSVGFNKVSEPLINVSIGYNEDGDMDVWGVHALGAVYRWDWSNNSWKAVASNRIGKASSVSVGSDGTVFCLGANKAIFKKGSWIRVRGQLDDVGVGTKDYVWGIVDHAIYKASDPVAQPTDNVIDPKWVSVAGAGGMASDISVGSDGSVWYLTTQGSLFRLDGDSWISINKNLSKIFVGDLDNVWGIDRDSNLFYSKDKGVSWEKKGANFIDGSADSHGNVWLIASEDIGGGVYTNVNVQQVAAKRRKVQDAAKQLVKLQASLKLAQEEKDEEMIKTLKLRIANLNAILKGRTIRRLRRELKKAEALGEARRVEQIKKQIQEVTGAEVKSELEKLKSEYAKERSKPNYNVDKLLRLKKRIKELEAEREQVFIGKIKNALLQKPYENKINAVAQLLENANSSLARIKRYLKVLMDLVKNAKPENLEFLKTLLEKVQADSKFVANEKIKDAVESLVNKVDGRIQIKALKKDLERAKLAGNTKRVEELQTQIKKIESGVPRSEIERLQSKLKKEIAKGDQASIEKMKDLRSRVKALKDAQVKAGLQRFVAKIKLVNSETDTQKKLEILLQILPKASLSDERRGIYLKTLQDLEKAIKGKVLSKLQALLIKVKADKAFINNDTARLNKVLDMLERVERGLRLYKLNRELQKAKILGDKQREIQLQKQISDIKGIAPTSEIERLKVELAAEAAKSDSDIEKMKELKAKIQKLEEARGTSIISSFSIALQQARDKTPFIAKIEEFKKLLSMASRLDATRKLFVDALVELVAMRTVDQLPKLQELLKLALYNEPLINNNMERKNLLNELYASSRSIVSREEIIRDLGFVVSQSKLTLEEKAIFIDEIRRLLQVKVLLLAKEQVSLESLIGAAIQSPLFADKKEVLQRFLTELQRPLGLQERVNLLRQMLANRVGLNIAYNRQSFIGGLLIATKNLIELKRRGEPVQEVENNLIEVLQKVVNDYSYPFTPDQRNQALKMVGDIRHVISATVPTEDSTFSQRLNYAYKLVTRDSFSTPGAISNYLDKLAKLVSLSRSAPEKEREKFADMLLFIKNIHGLSDVQKSVIGGYYKQVRVAKSLDERVDKMIVEASAAMASPEKAARFVLKLQELLNDILVARKAGKKIAAVQRLITTLNTVKNMPAFLAVKEQVEAVVTMLGSKPAEVAKTKTKTEIKKEVKTETKAEAIKKATRTGRRRIGSRRR